MITYVISDLFQSPAKVLVNTVNTEGVMGKGLAKDFKAVFPEMFREYQQLCENGKLTVGRLWLFRGQHKWVLNFPTKEQWRAPSKPEYIEAGLKTFVREHAKHSITSVAFPQLGCGHGELDWESQVRPLMEKHLGRLQIDIFIHLYQRGVFPVEHKNIRAMKTWLRSEPESLAFSEVWEDLSARFATRRTLRTLQSQRTFTVELVDEPETGLRIENDESVFIPHEALLDAWQHIRSAGFLTTGGLTQGLDRHGEYVLALLAELPYLKPAQFNRKLRATHDSFALGLQWLPRPAQQQLSLLKAPAEIAS